MNNSIDKKLNLILTEYADWDDIEPYRTKAVDQIKALFEERDKSLASKIEELKLPENGRGTKYGEGYNYALENVLELLKEEK